MRFDIGSLTLDSLKQIDWPLVCRLYKLKPSFHLVCGLLLLLLSELVKAGKTGWFGFADAFENALNILIEIDLPSHHDGQVYLARPLLYQFIVT